MVKSVKTQGPRFQWFHKTMVKTSIQLTSRSAVRCTPYHLAFTPKDIRYRGHGCSTGNSCSFTTTTSNNNNNNNSTLNLTYRSKTCALSKASPATDMAYFWYPAVKTSGVRKAFVFVMLSNWYAGCHVTFCDSFLFRVQLANADLMVQYVQSKEHLKDLKTGPKTLKSS